MAVGQTAQQLEHEQLQVDRREAPGVPLQVLKYQGQVFSKELIPTISEILSDDNKERLLEILMFKLV